MASKIYPDAPRVAVGAVIIDKQEVLLVLRGQPPQEGMWAIPGGSVELGETLQAAAEREVQEETGLHVEAGNLVYSFDAIHHDAKGNIKYHYVILDLQARLIGPRQQPKPADDVRDARWFSLAEVNSQNWPISPTTRTLLNKLLADPNAA